METTLGIRIGLLRREKGLKQEELAERMGVSPQAVSKWENDLNCPDIALLPQLAKTLGVTVDHLLTGEKPEPPVRLAPEGERKDLQDLFLKIVMESADGHNMRVNLPMVMVQTAINAGMVINGNIELNSIGLDQVIALAEQGAVGKLVEMESPDGNMIRVFVE